MKELCAFANISYLEEIGDELYQYAVDHPDEYLAHNLYNGVEHPIKQKIIDLYSQGVYLETLLRRRKAIKEGKDVPTLGKYSKWFIEKYPQWKKLYYYDFEEELKKQKLL